MRSLMDDQNPSAEFDPTDPEFLCALTAAYTAPDPTSDADGEDTFWATCAESRTRLRWAAIDALTQLAVAESDFYDDFLLDVHAHITNRFGSHRYAASDIPLIHELTAITVGQALGSPKIPYYGVLDERLIRVLRYFNEQPRELRIPVLLEARDFLLAESTSIPD
jgi:hypothetical protein